MTEEMKPEAQEAVEDYKDKYLRLLAELDNTRKRMQKEKQEMVRFSVESVISDMLIPLDNLENALKCADQMSGEVKNWAQGFLMILEQFKEVLQEHGVTSFNSEGELFNPELHYAIESEEGEEGRILKEYVKGYRSKERTIRPAKVKVGIKSVNQSKEN
ncbi:MAG: Heat shock protein GrpE [Chlamydiota bacterium]|jgi:molecular chaperone GrpE